ncbi:interferon-induced helicase C domain-containing protein 1-like [Mytilus trossulus]|uniref:interferon-induced helicase C domain-containing protein 1-like n=1 Tax=Mytilus trossulus TaxID=6551 RepID=UPI0030079CEC
MTSPLKDILGGNFLSFIAKLIGHRWRPFFTRLKFESYHCDHLAADNPHCPIERIIKGLTEWKKRQLPKVLIDYKSIEEITDWLLIVLESECERKDISDDIKKDCKDMDEIIEMLTVKVTEDRPRLFGALEIDWQSLEAELPTGSSLKRRTEACLDTWFTEQQLKYWKYQELLYAFRDSELDSEVDSIIEKFGIKELQDAGKYFRAEEKDTHRQILFQQSPTDKALSKKSEDAKYMRHKRPFEGTIVENGACKKKVKTISKEKITDMDTNTGEETTAAIGSQQSLIHLRDYQQELAVLALKGVNTIIYAGTNAGKTYVALKVVENHLEKNTTGKVVFMATTNALLGQQFDTTFKLLPDFLLKGTIRKWEASQDVTNETFKNLVKRCSILFITPASLCNFLDDELENTRVDINEFTLFVLDECHHTYGKTPYNKLMGHYRKKKFRNGKSNLPQIMGLTASPGTNRAKDKSGAKDHLLRIMTNLDVKELSVVKEYESSLLKYSSKPVKVPILSKKRRNDPVKKILMGAMDDVEVILDSRQVTTYLSNTINKADDLSKALNNPPKDRTIEHYILWLSETKKKIEEMLINETQALRLMHACVRHLEFYSECLEVNSLLDIIHIRKNVEEGVKRLKEESKMATGDKEKELIEILNEVWIKIKELGKRIEGNPDVDKIIEVLKDKYQKQGDKSRFIIFVKTRMTAKALAEKLPDEFKSRHLTGSQVSKEEGGLSKEEQIAIVNRFKAGKHLCLVATSIACEGLDIQQCTLVICYRLKSNEITSLQMRGRIRHEDGIEVHIGSQTELEREEINVERLFLMDSAMQDVLKEDVRQYIEMSERIIYQREEQERLQLKTNFNSEKKGQFYINCASCGKFIVDGQYIRRIKKTHVIVCDKEIFDKITRKPRNPRPIDNIKITDKVHGCFPCGHDWGSIFIYKDCEFVSLSQDNKTIVNKETKEPFPFQKWSDVHMEFPLDDITDNELIEYQSKL